MAIRMRLHATALIAVLLSAFPAVGSAAETWTCWSALESRGDDGTVQATRCRLAGSTETVDYGSASDVPYALSARVGTDRRGVCWYWTTRGSDWVILGIDDDGHATLGIDPDGGNGGPLLVDAVYPRCTSEPDEAPPALLEAYELLARYEHPTPTARLDPPARAGVAGMEVFLAEEPPAPWNASLVSPHSGRRVEVDTRVEAVEVDWGDGQSTVIPESAFVLLTGWPDGGFAHVYESKTCAVPGGPRCHPSLQTYPVVVSYRWSARFRVDSGAWLPIPVPPTATSVDYDVDEILAVTTAVG